MPFLLVAAFLAQPPGVRVNPVEVRRLDRTNQEARDGFLRDLDELADGYEQAGAIDRAKETLKFRLTIDDESPQAAKAKAKLEELDELRFENESEIKFDAIATWFNTGIDVAEGQEVRITATGDYRLMVNQELTAAGVANPEEAAASTDGYDAQRPLGVLLGRVYPPRPRTEPSRTVPSRRRSTNQRGSKKVDKAEPSDPVEIGASSSFAPPVAGRLFLKLNVPPDARLSGSLTITIAGPHRVAR